MWATEAIERLDGEAAPTPLIDFPVPGLRLKDESAHPTGTLKHRLARALFRYGVACGRIREDTVVVEATGGGSAVAQAYFARLLGLRFVAVMPGDPSPERAAPVEELGGECRFVNPPLAIYDEARRLAEKLGGHFMDQFAWAERAIDWRSEGLAEELFAQVGAGRPADWVVVGAGTGATAAALGRHIRLHGRTARLAVVDPENSAYFPGWAYGVADYGTGMPSRIEGIGRPRLESGFVPSLYDLVVPVPDAASVAAARLVRSVTGLPVGGSTGANLWGALELVSRGHEVVTLVADAGPRYLRTVHDDGWAAGKGLAPRPYSAVLERFLTDGVWTGRDGVPGDPANDR
ncbi:pyridoxal-phosphate dependent enzyme [Streptosporangium sp. NPDC051022]|uniref:PLP-dependent cysteine synthase family protein n=1 Tax=Streptosporangium sp. NPDC051022 TaxID=3155752 RepID=UPI003449A581